MKLEAAEKGRMNGEKPNMGREDGKRKRDVEKLKSLKRRGWNQEKA
jgi:hypothetical protein